MEIKLPTNPLMAKFTRSFLIIILVFIIKRNGPFITGMFEEILTKNMITSSIISVQHDKLKR